MKTTLNDDLDLLASPDELELSEFAEFDEVGGATPTITTITTSSWICGATVAVSIWTCPTTRCTSAC